MKTSNQIREEIGSIDNDLRLIHTRVAAARLAIAQLSKTAIVSLAFARGGEDDNPANHVAPVLAFCRSDAGRDLAAATVVLGVLEADPAFSEARAALDPLHQELAAAVEREAAEAHEERKATAALAEAEAAAREKIEGKVQADPNVQKARQALASIRRLGQPLDVLAEDFHD